MEGLCSNAANPFADAQALHGLAMLARGLPRVKSNPADLQARLDMPRTLRSVGIGPESFGRIAEGAIATPWIPHNPRPIEHPAQVREILDLAA
ncbi:MAG: hypothetical protein ACKVQA_03990 [Burkholderiales bacterium]